MAAPVNIFPLEIWKNWDKTGKNEFLKQVKQSIKDEPKQEPTFEKLPALIIELVGNTIKGNIKKESTVTTLQELATYQSNTTSLMLDTLNMLDAETAENPSEDNKERIIFNFILKEVEKLCPDNIIKERMEIDTLQEVGILKNRQFYTKYIKVKTKIFYKQKKFNLYREESEGFSKLLSELCILSVNTTSKNLLDKMYSLIGRFNLDPNRVLDVILECFENLPAHAPVFIELIKLYMNDPKTISEVLGSKYTVQRNSNGPVPVSLFILTANLLQYEIITMDDIYIWLVPDDRVMFKHWDKEMKDAKEYVRKLSIISLNNKEKDETAEERDNPMDLYAGNQKLNICEALLKVGDWKNAKLFIDRLPDNYAVGFQPLATAICDLLHYIIEPIYRENWKMGKIQGKPIPSHPSPMAPKQATTLLELREVAFPMLHYLGPSLHFDVILLYKILRLSKYALSIFKIDSTKPAPEAESLYYDILTLLDITILPSLSYLEGNCPVAIEIWSLLKLFPYHARYCLYSRWKNESHQIYPELMRRRGDSEKKIKNIMKRVSKDNSKIVGKVIGKITHCAPGFLFDYVLVQIQVYDNLIHPVVDSLKYSTNLSYDVLGFCLIESLANADKKRIKHDSTSISGWLQSLSSFCGAVLKKYNFEITGLLQYVANQLKDKKSLDLLILKEIVEKMAGIETIEDLTMDQLNAMSGGDVLKIEAGSFNQIRNTKKSSQRLKEAMSEDGLAVALCLLIAQQKCCVVYHETKQIHLKLVGKLSDQCQDTLVQFGTFLGSTLTVDEYVQNLPSIQSMLLEFNIPSEVAFFLARPMFNHAIQIKYDELRKSDSNYKKMSSSLKNQKYYDATTDVMKSVQKSLINIHPMKVYDDLSPQFLATFWSLTMYDLYVPEDAYAHTINKFKQLALNLTDSTTSKGKKEIEKYQTIIEKLQDERKKQQEHVDKVLYRLKQEKDTWFQAKSIKNDTIMWFLQLCIFPRCTFTAIDAVYCAKFFHTIHSLKTVNFSTVLCFDRLFCDITYSVTSCTENEAVRYGRFLFLMLETMMKWHKSKDIFEKECSNYPGFVTKFRAMNEISDHTDQVGYENYRHVCHKWHYKIAKALIVCLESKDYIQIRNSLIILIKIIPHFPPIVKLSQIIEKKVQKLSLEEKNNRQDLYTLAISYVGLLRNKIMSGGVVTEKDFHQVIEKPNALVDTTKDANKQNGENKAADNRERLKENRDDLRKRTSEESKKSNTSQENITKERSSEKDRQVKEDSREKYSRKEEKREEGERDRERDKRRERKDEKLTNKEDRQYSREDRYIEVINQKEEIRYSNDRLQNERYFDERGSHYYRDVREDREVSINNGSSSSKHPESTDPDRDAKRRKLEVPASKNYKHEEHKFQQPQHEFSMEKVEKKERSAKSKDKREKMSEEEKELRKERKLGRKRDRAEEALQAEIKRKNEEKAKTMAHQNGELMESQHAREKFHHSREVSPYLRERESRSNDRMELRESKHRRSSENKRR